MEKKNNDDKPKIAVALEYTPGEQAPKILATGRGYIAESIIDLSTRANVKPEILANYFDDTMPLRIAKEFQRQTLKKSKSI